MIELTVFEMDYLTDSEISKIHETSLEILEEVGMKWDNEEALEIFDEHGADVDFSEQIVKIPPFMVEESIENAPSECTLYSRNKEYDIPMEDGEINFGPFGFANFVRDPETGKRREATAEDLRKLTKLVDTIDDWNFQYLQVAPQDVDPKINYLVAHAIQLKNSEKHLVAAGTSQRVVEDTVRIAKALSDDFEEHPFLSFDHLTVPPLTEEKSASAGLVEAAKRGLPVLVSEGVMAGSTSPVTLAGALAQSSAGALGVLTLVQLINPGTPTLYGSFARIMDMKRGTVSMGGPEWTLLKKAWSDLAEFYDLPNWYGCMLNDAKIVDAQAGYEKALSSLLASFSKKGLMVQCATIDQNRMCDFGNILVNKEISEAILRIKRGFEVNENTLALDVIKEVGPRGSFMSTQHTLDNYKSVAWDPDLSERGSYEDWEEEGEKTLYDKALKNSLDRIEEHVSPKIPEEAEKKIDAIIEEARKDGVKL